MTNIKIAVIKGYVSIDNYDCALKLAHSAKLQYTAMQRSSAYKGKDHHIVEVDNGYTGTKMEGVHTVIFYSNDHVIIYHQECSFLSTGWFDKHFYLVIGGYIRENLKFRNPSASEGLKHQECNKINKGDIMSFQKEAANYIKSKGLETIMIDANGNLFEQKNNAIPSNREQVQEFVKNNADSLKIRMDFLGNLEFSGKFKRKDPEVYYEYQWVYFMDSRYQVSDYAMDQSELQERFWITPLYNPKRIEESKRIRKCP